MVVAILHQDNELKLLKLRKKLLTRLNSNNRIFYESMNLWLHLSYLEKINLESNNYNNDKIYLKEIAKLIKNITLKGLEWDNNNSKIIIKADLSIYKKNNNNETFLENIEEKIPFINLLTAPEDFINSIPKILSDFFKEQNDNLFPMDLKIFRLGITQKPGKNALAISDFIWVKEK